MSAVAQRVGKTAFGLVFGFDEDTALIIQEDHQHDGEDNQDSIGAPVEKHNPLGYNLDYTTAFYLVIQGIIGTGIFLSPASIVKSIGSIGASYVLWVSGFFIALSEVLVYIEYVTYYRRRSGGQVVYLEQAFPKPEFLVPTTFAAVTVILSFSTSSAVAFGTYILNASGLEATAWRQRGIGTAALAFSSILTAASSKYSARLSNFLGFVKIVSVLFIIVTGLVVLSGKTRVKNSHAIFQNAWAGTTSDGNAISNAIIKVSFSFGGSQYVFGLAGEANPKKSKNMFRYFLPGILVFVLFLYILIITSFYASFGTIEELQASGTLVAAEFFSRVFGTKAAVKALDVLVALSALGHLNATVLSNSRSLREIGRQGVVPYPRIWTSIKPWGTPLFALLINFIVNLIVLLAPPAGDAYNFIVDIGSYSGYIFKLLLLVGLLSLRRKRKAAGLGFQGWKVPTVIIYFTIAFYIFVIAMAWVPPKGTLIGSDVSFLYCAYAIACVGILLLCVFYYYVWAKILPKIGSYKHRLSYYELPSGERGHTVIQVKLDDLAQWDAEHNTNGKFTDDVRDSEISSVIEVEVPYTEKK